MNIVQSKFVPRPYQSDFFRAFFVEKKRRFLRVLHRRAGKDHESFNLFWMAALLRPGLYFYLLPKIDQARTVIWQGRGKTGVALLDYIPKAVIDGKPNETRMQIKLINGSLLRITGSDNYEALIGSNPLGIVFSEYQSSDEMAWNLLRPIAAENGAWVSFNGTPRGHNHFYELYQTNKDNPDWHCQLLTVNDTHDELGNPIITQQVIDEERKAGMPEEIVQQEFYCSFEAGIQGAYFAHELSDVVQDNRICNLSIHPQLPVHVSWDLGMSDSMALCLFQVVDDCYHCIAYFEDSGYGFEYYVAKLHHIQSRLKFARWGFDFVPHDSSVRELGTGRTRFETLQSLGRKLYRIPTKPGIVVERIQCIRSMLPKVKFNEPETKKLIRALTEYHAKVDEKRGITKGPEHDWSSHAVDAFGYFAYGYLDAFDKPKLAQQQHYASFYP